MFCSQTPGLETDRENLGRLLARIQILTVLSPSPSPSKEIDSLLDLLAPIRVLARSRRKWNHTASTHRTSRRIALAANDRHVAQETHHATWLVLDTHWRIPIELNQFHVRGLGSSISARQGCRWPRSSMGDSVPSQCIWRHIDVHSAVAPPWSAGLGVSGITVPKT